MKKSLAGTAVWTALSTAIKIAVGLLLMKLFTLQFGSQGLGQAANFMTLLTVLGAFAGAGIFNGVTKYVAEFEKNPPQLTALFATSGAIVVGFSALLAVGFWLFSAPISQWLFYSADFQNVVIATGFCQFGIALSNYALAILKGYRHAKGTAISTIVGVLLGLVAFLISLYGFGYQGALIGLAIMPALTVFPAFFFLKRQLQGVGFLPNLAKFSPDLTAKLLKFSLMVLITAITLPVGYVLLRDLLMANYSLEAVGLWQAMSKISDAYLQFITAAFSVYLLPTFAKLTEKSAIKQELVKFLRIVAVAVIAVSLTIFALKKWIILLLYSEHFLAMADLFQWQLIGDIFKVLAYIFGYLIVAKSALKLYILAEVLQFSLLVGFGYWLIPTHGAIGATQAYAITYLVYFGVCVVGALRFFGR
ncbi:O-antigen translocase [Haemophilus paracuniculus]|uniref:O-antigen translocase n=1 Tax=Haemophilus paracuniculus TaxID=734 RepID=A0A1T0AV55_9PAST|nr:lipid III flippase WzxE [Haemophilus paracuniculus]OOS00817.1 O-antigen translocase [Haemophilus paracuniculus]